MKSQNPELTILQTARIADTNKRSEIHVGANGGNSILIVCDPLLELEYIQAIRKIMTDDNYRIIDLNQLLIDFFTANKEDLEELFDLLRASVEQIFKAPAGEDRNDLFKAIIDRISAAFEVNKIPVLIGSGALYGSGIDNLHIMEHEKVMKASIPLIILYPASNENGNLLFLSQRPASKYRCLIINDYN